MYQITINNNEPLAVELNEGEVSVAGKNVQFEMIRQPDGGYSILADGKSHQVYVESVHIKEKTASVLINNKQCSINIQEPIDIQLKKMGINMAAGRKADAIKAPMPGLVLKMLVTEGQELKKGDPVLILEAMKMENVFKAPADATVKAIKIAEGTAVEKGTVLIELA